MFNRSRSWVGYFLALGIASGVTSCSSGQKSAEVIPATETYVTVRQEGAKYYDLPADSAWQQAFRESGRFKSTLSALFLVRAKDIDEAVREATHLGGARGGHSLGLEKANAPDIWLVVFFGVGSSKPAQWIVKNVEVNRPKITVNYEEPVRPGGAATTDLVPYFVLAPLGKLAPGDYQLELRNLETKQVMLMRQVSVRREE